MRLGIQSAATAATALEQTQAAQAQAAPFDAHASEPDTLVEHGRGHAVAGKAARTGPGRGLVRSRVLPAFLPVQSGNADAGPEVGIKGGGGAGENSNQCTGVAPVGRGKKRRGEKPGKTRGSQDGLHQGDNVFLVRGHSQMISALTQR